MLSGEGNENGEKTTIGLIYSKKATLYVQHTFLYISLPLFCATTKWNFQTLPSYPFYGGHIVRVLVHFFFCTAAHFQIPSVAVSISYFLTAATKFSCCSSNQKCFLCFLSLAQASCRSFTRWASLAYRVLCLFLCLSPSLYSKFVGN